jgi:hypothetical protein
LCLHNLPLSIFRTDTAYGQDEDNVTDINLDITTDDSFAHYDVVMAGNHEEDLFSKFVESLMMPASWQEDVETVNC